MLAAHETPPTPTLNASYFFLRDDISEYFGIAPHDQVGIIRHHGRWISLRALYLLRLERDSAAEAARLMSAPEDAR